MRRILLFFSLSITAAHSSAEEIVIASLAELERYASLSGNQVTLAAGVYRLIDHIPLESIPARREARNWQFLNISGSGNVFRCEGVTIELDTRLRQALRAPMHNAEFVMSGDGNQLSGLTITNIGGGTSAAGCLLAITGDGNTLQGCTFHVAGSFPYGYGDLFGKGGSPVISHRKHSGVLINGSDNRLIGCKLFMRSYGHGFYMQAGKGHYLEDCHVEGEMRSTDEMLAEVSGPAFEVDFRTEARNRQGERRVTHGYMKALSEDGFRAYAQVSDVTLVRCTAKNMRAGFEFRPTGTTRIEDCTAIGNERGFWVGGGAVITGSRGDVRHGPLLFIEGNGVRADLELLPGESEALVHALATIHGDGHQVTLRQAEGGHSKKLPILLGYSQPGAGEGMSPIGQRATRGVTLRNETSMPVSIGSEASGSHVITRGPLEEDAGYGSVIEELK